MNTSNGRFKLALAILVASLPGVALADGHWLFGGSIGNASVDEPVDGFVFDSSSTSFRLYGGYEFNDYFTLEAGYMDLGDFDESLLLGGQTIDIAADASGFTFSARGTLPLGEKFSLLASIGSFFWDGKTQIAGIRDNVSDSNMFFGVGAIYSFSPGFSLRADISRFELDGVDSDVGSVGFQIDFQ